MWIRNQRKNALVNINFLRVINDGNYCLICGATTDGYDCEKENLWKIAKT